MTLTLLTEHHLEFLSLTRGCTGSSESTFVKIPHRWLSHVTAHLAENMSLPKLLPLVHTKGLVGCFLLKLPVHKAEAKDIAQFEPIPINGLNVVGKHQ